ncbi:MAG TPA: helix-turn-helix transcriptional regulator [Pseudonocardiaceae bacterium]|jgi:transcriptional regulator with XRE-family HTH domain|nr:helix-turn-helix transcriptional regulator [Pseudonocardiaceae bacterium]
MTDRPVGEMLREWREQRRLSQLELSSRAEISTRHLSFVETGRSAPSRAMVLHLTEQLDVPLRERNRLLLAAGFAPVYGETSLDAPRMAAIRAAVGQVLAAHEPYPAVVVDRWWDLVDSNASARLLIDSIAPELLEPPLNVLRASLHPDGMAKRIINLGEWRAHLLAQLRHQVAVTADPRLAELYAELSGYPGGDEPGPSDASGVIVPLRLRHESGELAFFSTVATFGTPLDVTVAELAIESFFPADEHTATVLRANRL